MRWRERHPSSRSGQETDWTLIDPRRRPAPRRADGRAEMVVPVRSICFAPAVHESRPCHEVRCCPAGAAARGIALAGARHCDAGRDPVHQSAAARSLPARACRRLCGPMRGAGSGGSRRSGSGWSGACPRARRRPRDPRCASMLSASARARRSRPETRLRPRRRSRCAPALSPTRRACASDGRCWKAHFAAAQLQP